MYLARVRKLRTIHYIIRHSYGDGADLKSRDLFDLGPAPERFIVYVGGNGYYYTEEVQAALCQAGLEVDQEQLDEIFFEFLDPKIQRVICGFDRSRRRCAPAALQTDKTPLPALHLFDKRRFYFLRFGRGDQGRIRIVPEKHFKPLLAKSRDELEQYFQQEERMLKAHEKASYITAIFELKRFMPEYGPTAAPLLEQMDAYFLSSLCAIDADARFWAGMPGKAGLHDYLIRYAIMYFDYAPPATSAWQAYVEDFINRHRAYQPPLKVKIKLEDAGRLFGMPWKELKKLPQRDLTRLYRRLALKFHPDQGGDPDLFRRLTHFYKLLRRRR